MEESNYYPFGLKHKGYNNSISGRDHKYDYNGKESNEELGLNWHDYGARNYDAALGRFMNMDRYAEKFESFSPYQYAANTPTLFIDKNGDYIYMYLFTRNKKTGKRSRQELRYNADKGTFMYHGGKNNGKAYAGTNAFVGSVTKALGDISSSGKTGKSLVNYLSNNSYGLKLRKSNSGNHAGKNGSYASFDPTSRKGGLDVNGKNDREPFIGLAHELAHVQDTWWGTKDSKEWFGYTKKGGKSGSTPNAEKYATYIENLIRGENGTPLREFYATTASEKSRIIKKGSSGSYENIHLNSLTKQRDIINKTILRSIMVVKPVK